MADVSLYTHMLVQELGLCAFVTTVSIDYKLIVRSTLTPLKFLVKIQMINLIIRIFVQIRNS